MWGPVEVRRLCIPFKYTVKPRASVILYITYSLSQSNVNHKDKTSCLYFLLYCKHPVPSGVGFSTSFETNKATTS